jgi:Xaa-Pro dipeptidase
MRTEALPNFSEAEMQRRQTAVNALCEQQGVDALLVFGNSGSRRHSQADVHYLTGVAAFHDGFALFQPGKEVLLWVTAHNHFASARDIALVRDVRRITRTPHVQIGEELRARKLDAARVGLIGAMPYTAMDALRSMFPDIRWTDVTLPYKQVRSRKGAEEIAYQRRAAEGCDAVMRALRDAIRPGVEEHELLVLSESVAWQSGCTPNFLYLNSTPMGAPTSCVPNQFLSRRKLQHGDVINTELTVSYGMYSAQLLRPFFIGEPTPEFARLYEVLKRVHDRLVASIRAGVALQDLYDITLEFKAHGYTSVDGVLHGFGVDLLPPRLPQGFLPPPAGAVLERDTTVVLQPNPTTPDERMGMQLGELGLVTDTGFESLHALPAEVVVCG